MRSIVPSIFFSANHVMAVTDRLRKKCQYLTAMLASDRAQFPWVLLAIPKKRIEKDLLLARVSSIHDCRMKNALFFKVFCLRSRETYYSLYKHLQYDTFLCNIRYYMPLVGA